MTKSINHKDIHILLGSLCQKVDDLKEHIQEVKDDIKSHNVKIDGLSKTTIEIKEGFDNHLKSHARTLKIWISVFSALVVGIVSLIITLIVKFWR